MSIDTSTADKLFETVSDVAKAKWSSLVEYPLDEDITHGRWLGGRVGDVDVELRASIVGTRPTVRVTAGIARFVPKSPALIAKLNSLNRDCPLITLGIAPETERQQTVKILASSSLLYDFITPTLVRLTMDNCAWNANDLLAGGFMARFGGELYLAAKAREMAAQVKQALELLEWDAEGRLELEQNAAKFLGLAAELEERVRSGEVGCY